MRRKLIWTPQAREDLLDIYVTIGLDNPAAAERFYIAIEEQAALLVQHPRIGVRRREISEHARTLVQGNYLLFDETHPDTDLGPIRSVEIVRILHGRRDLSRMF